VGTLCPFGSAGWANVGTVDVTAADRCKIRCPMVTDLIMLSSGRTTEGTVGIQGEQQQHGDKERRWQVTIYYTGYKL
jgi:hypothetical protein